MKWHLQRRHMSPLGIPRIQCHLSVSSFNHIAPCKFHVIPGLQHWVPHNWDLLWKTWISSITLSGSPTLCSISLLFPPCNPIARMDTWLCEFTLLLFNDGTQQLRHLPERPFKLCLHHPPVVDDPLGTASTIGRRALEQNPKTLLRNTSKHNCLKYIRICL
jgi:hypothetical protein